MLGTPAIVLEGPHLAKAIILTSWQHHMDSVAEWSKGGGSRRHSVRVWVRAPLLVIPTHQTDRCRWSQATPPFFSVCFWMCLRNHHQAEIKSGVAQWLLHCKTSASF